MCLSFCRFHNAGEHDVARVVLALHDVGGAPGTGALACTPRTRNLRAATQIQFDM